MARTHKRPRKVIKRFKKVDLQDAKLLNKIRNVYGCTISQAVAIRDMRSITGNYPTVQIN